MIQEPINNNNDDNDDDDDDDDDDNLYIHKVCIHRPHLHN